MTVGGYGSFGLRILSSLLTIALPQQKSAMATRWLNACNFWTPIHWGPVQTADVEIASEKASSVPIHVLSDTDFTVPAGCSEYLDLLPIQFAALGANGILGVGLFAQDCGPACVQSSTNTPSETRTMIVLRRQGARRFLKACHSKCRIRLRCLPKTTTA